jgi:hypothetical protein
VDSRLNAVKALATEHNARCEVGLFHQRRFGFKKPIVLLGEGCDEFSHIAGLGPAAERPALRSQPPAGRRRRRLGLKWTATAWPGPTADPYVWRSAFELARANCFAFSSSDVNGPLSTTWRDCPVGRRPVQTTLHIAMCISP